MCSFQSANFGSVNQIPPKYAVVKTVTAGLPTTFIDILSINRSFTDHFRDLLCCLCGLPAQENKGVAAIYDCFAIVLINGRNLRQALQNYHAAYVSASDRRDQPVEIRNLSYVGELIKQTSNMERQFAAVFVVCFFAKQIEHLVHNHSDQKGIGTIRIAHNHKKGCFSISQFVKLQFVVQHNFPQLVNIKRSQPGSTGNQNTFKRFPRRLFELFVLLHRKAIWLFLFQIFKHNVDRALIIFVVLFYFAHIQHFNHHGNVLIFRWGFIPKVSDKCRV